MKRSSQTRLKNNSDVSNTVKKQIMAMNKKSIAILSLGLLICLASFSKPEELKPAKTVTTFLKWYKENMERLNKIPLVLNYANGASTNGKPYLVDFKGTEKWLTEIKKSTFIGPKFIDKWRKYFIKCNE